MVASHFVAAQYEYIRLVLQGGVADALGCITRVRVQVQA
jgi:hypothetical protein